jgi:2-polyprenyl-6-hydroxyphenyl methylase/3-demethylubiquinone-9 3-methyltransferase
MKRPVLDPSWPASVRESYDYDELELWGSRSDYAYTVAYRTRFDMAIHLLRQAVPPGALVLDVAAAQGNLSLTLAELGYRVVWNDLRAELAEYVKMKHERGVVSFRPGNVLELSFEERFDAVLATEVIEHVAHPDVFLARLADLLTKDGAIVLTTPNGGYCRNRLPRFSECPDPSAFEALQFRPNADGHIFLLHTDELTDLARRAGLRVEKLILFANPLTCGHMQLRRVLPFLPGSLVELLERAGRWLPMPLRNWFSVELAAVLRRSA